MVDHLQDGGDTKQTDQHGDQGDTVHQTHLAEGKTGQTGLGAHSHTAEDQTHSHGQNIFHNVFAGHADYGTHTQNCQHEILGRAEFQSLLRQEGRQKQQHDGAGKSSECGRGDRQAQGLTALALLGHGITVVGGYRSGGSSRNL